jgi:predicted nucleotidyltransferase
MTPVHPGIRALPVRDPDEGVRSDGTIVTGARRHRVPAAFEPVVRAAVAEVGKVDSNVQLYLYGSVATGQARIAKSDVDLLSIGLPAPAAAEIGRELSHRFRALCRAVEFGPARPEDIVGSGDEAYGLRVFLRHYCVQLAGELRTDLATAYLADIRAARGFNGDIAAHARRWREALDEGADPSRVGNLLARKALLAVASLVSVHDAIWTTDRAGAASRWAAIDPASAKDLQVLVNWAEGSALASLQDVQRVLDGTVGRVVRAVAETIGLWSGDRWSGA